MAPKPGPRALVLLVAVILLLAGCGNWWQQQQRAARERAARQQCLARWELISSRLALVQADQQALKRIEAETYLANPMPVAPDPEQANRYSQLDRELDQERYQEQLTAWTTSEQQRRARWQRSRRERRQRVEQRLQQHLGALAALDPVLVRGKRPDRNAIERLSRCQGA